MAGEASVSRLAAAYDMSFAAVQKHVAVLEGAGLVTKQPNGRERIIRANPETIREAQALLDRYEEIWRARVDRLDTLLAEPVECLPSHESHLRGVWNIAGVRHGPKRQVQVSLRSQFEDPPEAAVDVDHEVVRQGSDRFALLEV
jgi:DNA-binding MarR family transcriptional regulator